MDLDEQAAGAEAVPPPPPGPPPSAGEEMVGAARPPEGYDPATAYAQDGSHDAYLQANIAAQVCGCAVVNFGELLVVCSRTQGGC